MGKQCKSLLLTFFAANCMATWANSQTQFEDEFEGDIPTICVSNIHKNGSTLGVCVSVKKHLRHCAPLHSLYLERKWEEFREHFCVPKGSKIAKVCCPFGSYTKVPAQNPDPDFKKHINYKLLPIDSCGLSYHTTESKIVGGNVANPGDFPWMARIGLTDPSGQVSFYVCGGSIISKRYVLTAAHCFKHRTLPVKVIQLAENDVDREYECIRDCVGDFCPSNGIVACSRPQEFEPEEVIIHEGYEYHTGSVNDIALIRLNRDINITNWFTRPICLPFLDTYNVRGIMEDEKLIRKKGYVAGWGKTSSDNESGSSIMRYVAVPMVPIVQCQLIHRSSTIVKSQLCAGGIEGKDICLGDSGSPFMYFAPTKLNSGSRITKLRHFQVGIVSHGRAACGKGGVPVVYTRVRSYLQWILDNLKP